MNHKKLISLMVAVMLTATVSLATGNEKEDINSAGNTNYSSNAFSINSYKYSTALGIRGLGTSGLTFKHFTSSSRAYEGILGVYPDALTITALVETYVSAFDQPGLNWYYGFGGHIATQSDWVYNDGYRGYRRADGDFGIGIDGIFGIEYKIREIPIAISMDVKPFLEVTTTGAAFLAVDPGLGIKFTF